MRLARLSLLILLSGFAASCADSSSSGSATPNGNPRPPVNRGDGSAYSPPIVGTETKGVENGGGGGSGVGNPGGGNPGGGSGSGGAGSGGGGSGGNGGPAAAVPEPGTIFLVGTGLAGLAMVRRRRQAAQQIESEPS